MEKIMLMKKIMLMSTVIALWAYRRLTPKSIDEQVYYLLMNLLLSIHGIVCIPINALTWMYFAIAHLSLILFFFKDQ